MWMIRGKHQATYKILTPCVLVAYSQHVANLFEAPVFHLGVGGSVKFVSESFQAGQQPTG